MSPQAGELHWLSIGQLAPLLQNRELSPVELANHYLERIERLDSQLNSYQLVMADSARAAARQAEEEIGRGAYRGPLHGVPLGIKDLFDVAGAPTTMGSRILANGVSERDATVVTRLREAGAVILGKQSMHEFAFGVTSENPHYGDVRNPWDTQRVAGGSSGGTGVAIAAGLCVAGLGSDTGGSIRIPASFCGTAGLKPTYGRVSRAGALPLSWSLDHVGPLARSVADCAILLEAIAGPDPSDASASSREVPRYTDHLSGGVSGLVLGVPSQHFFDLVEPEVVACVRAAIGVLEGLGARLAEVPLPHAQHAQMAGTAIMSSEAATWHAEWLRTRPDEYGPDVLLRIRHGLLVRATEYLLAQQMRTLLQQDFTAAFERGVQAILAPTLPVVAPRIGSTFEPGGSFNMAPRSVITRTTVPANLAGLPAMSVPCGFSQDLPVGLQVTGPSFGEPMVLRVAHAYEQATDWHLRRPPLAV
jgi:aspartyl-tRNA(Asn)/glutamyl-tRNA(Gln) amidotransferase subunit A